MLASLARSFLPDIIGKLTSRGITYGGPYLQDNGDHIRIYRTREPEMKCYQDNKGEIVIPQEVQGAALLLGPNSPFKSIPLIGAIL